MAYEINEGDGAFYGPKIDFKVKLFAAGVRVKLDDRSESMGYKIREALQGNKIPYVLVMGDKEIEEGKVAIRMRGIGEAGKLTPDEFVDKILAKIKTKEQNLEF